MSTHPLTADFGVVLCTPSAAMQTALNEAIEKVSRMSLIGKRDSSVLRSIYAATSGRIIVNVPSENLLKGLGSHSMVFALTVSENPPDAAEMFAETIQNHGFIAMCHHGLEPEIPILSFVTIEAMPKVAFVMWPEQSPENAPPITPKS